MNSSAQVGAVDMPQKISGETSRVSAARPGVTIVEADPLQYQAEIIRLFKEDGKAEFQNQFDWYYRNTGQEKPVSWLLRDGAGRIRGLISVTVRPMAFRGTDIRAGVAGNLIVDHGSGIYFGASSLVRAALSLVRNNRLDVLLGIPNEFSQPVFNRLRCHTIDRWRTFAQMFRCRELLTSRMGLTGMLAAPAVDVCAAARRLSSNYYRQNLGLQIFEAGPQHCDELAASVLGQPVDTISVATTGDYLRARFLQHPSKQYSLLGIRRSSGECSGYLAVRYIAERLWVSDCQVDTSQTTKAHAIVACCRQREIRTLWVPSLTSNTLSVELLRFGFIPVSASMGGYSDYPLVGFWRDDHALAPIFSQASSWDLLPGFNDV